MSHAKNKIRESEETGDISAIEATMHDLGSLTKKVEGILLKEQEPNSN